MPTIGMLSPLLMISRKLSLNSAAMSPAVRMTCGTTSIRWSRMSFIRCLLSHRAGDAAVLPDTPEVDDHEKASDEREAHAVPDVETKQSALPDDRSAEQRRANVSLDVDETDGLRERPVRAEKR